MTDDRATGRVDAWMGGPRGRRLLAEVVTASAPAEDGAPWGYPAWSLPDDPAPLPDPVRAAMRDRLAAAVAALDPAAGWVPDPRTVLPALADSVVAARYWQHPDREDAVLADPEFADLLRPVAEALVAAPACRSWSEPVDPGEQWQVRWVLRPGDRRPGPAPSTRGARETLRRLRAGEAQDEARARRERAGEVTRNWSGEWWSFPPEGGGLVATDASLPASLAGGAAEPCPAGLVLVEDDLGAQDAWVRRVPVRDDVRVLEIRDGADWAGLVSRHPRAVTFSRRHDWYRSTGWDGSWALPDWASVAEEYDGVHLTLDGYLAVSGALLTTTVPGEPAPPGASLRAGAARTLLAGWDPGRTSWLTDVLAPHGAGAPHRWRAPGDHVGDWAPAGW
ncbi:hypothetical protein ACFFKU_11360 [Kineococcus gynurae]|uniref:Uncharacterized protein n=1 Tax=Kineococcus gynurae TaxID=452979 RepID=A0ABV5LUG1_9ACTN